MMKYIYGIGGSALLGFLSFLFIYVTGIKSDLKDAQAMNARLESNNSQLESQVASQIETIGFLEAQAQTTESAQADLQADLAKARDRKVPVRVRTITVTAEADPIEAQVIAREEMTNVLRQIEDTTASDIDG